MTQTRNTVRKNIDKDIDNEKNKKQIFLKRVKKPGLLIILILNLVLMSLSGYMVYKYFSDSKYRSKVAISSDIEHKKIKKKEEGSAAFNVISEPSQAKVFVGGYYKGKTPLKVEVFSVKDNRTYKLTIIKQDYVKWEKNIELYAGDSKEFNIKLNKTENEVR